MLHPVPTRTSPAQAHPTAATSTASTLRGLPGTDAARDLKLAAADTSEPDRRHEDDDNDEAAWLSSGDEAAAATDTVGSAGADTAGASSVTGGVPRQAQRPKPRQAPHLPLLAVRCSPA